MLWRVEELRSKNDTPERVMDFKRRLEEQVAKIKDNELKRVYHIFLQNKLKENYKSYFSYRLNNRSNLSSSLKDKIYTNVLSKTNINRLVLSRERILVGAMINNFQLLSRNDEFFASLPITNKELSQVRTILIDIIATSKISNSLDLKNKLIDFGYSKLLKKHYITKDCLEFNFFESYANEGTNIEKAEIGWKEAAENQQKWYDLNNK